MKIRHYWRYYQQIIRRTLATLLEYRFNVLFDSIYSLVYLVGLAGMLFLMFEQTDSIGGFVKEELFFMLTLSAMTWSFNELTYFEGFKKLMLRDIKSGYLDFYLLKPISPQFQVATSDQIIEVLPQLILMIGILIYQIITTSLPITVLNILSFILAYAGGLIIIYNFVVVLASTAFFTIESSQLIRSMYMLNDHAQFPQSIYPQAVQMLFLTIIPIAFLAYVPTLFLIGRASFIQALYVVGGVILSTVISRIIWHKGLRAYESASS